MIFISLPEGGGARWKLQCETVGFSKEERWGAVGQPDQSSCSVLELHLGTENSETR